MNNIFGSIVTGMLMAVAFACLILFAAFIGALIVYLIWNHLAPIYFIGILPAQFIHIPFLHCWMFLILFALVFGNKTSSSSSK